MVRGGGNRDGPVEWTVIGNYDDKHDDDNHDNDNNDNADNHDGSNDDDNDVTDFHLAGAVPWIVCKLET